MTRHQATPTALRAIPPSHPRQAVRFEDHQCLGCLSIVAQVVLGAVLVYALLLLIGTGPW